MTGVSGASPHLLEIVLTCTLSFYEPIYEICMMKKNYKAWQKAVFYTGIASFIASAACIIYVYLKIDGLGWDNPVSASLLATSFFFASTGIVLVTIGKTNLPSFKVGKPDSDLP